MQEFDVDNKYGCDALQRMYEDFAGDTDGAMPGVQVGRLLLSSVTSIGRPMSFAARRQPLVTSFLRSCAL